MLSPRAAEALEVRLVLEAINACYGYDFRLYARDSIARRVVAAASQLGAGNLGELQHRLIADPAAFWAFLDVLVVRVTEMFRDPEVYRAIRERILPLLRTYPELKVWHAGCASGEEVYATAILLTEAGIYDRTQIYATDMSPTAVAQTREGVYPESMLPKLARNYHEAGGQRDFNAYWLQAYGGISVSPALKRNVHVFQHDLVSDYSLGEMQLIFCRNVLIYFGEELRQRVFGLFSDGLARGGFLCLGASEALPATHRDDYIEVSAAERLFQRRSDV